MIFSISVKLHLEFCSSLSGDFDSRPSIINERIDKQGEERRLIILGRILVGQLAGQSFVLRAHHQPGLETVIFDPGKLLSRQQWLTKLRRFSTSVHLHLAFVQAHYPGR